MTQAAELKSLFRAVDDLRAGADAVRRRYGEIPAVKRLVGDVDRISLDAHDLDGLPTPAERSAQSVEYISDDPVDHMMFAEADDEGVGGYYRGPKR